MIYRHIAPGQDLQEFVRDYLIAHFVFDKNQSIPFKPFSPKPELAIVFLPKGYLTIINSATGQTYKSPNVSICGQQISRYNFYLPPEYLMVRVNFHPGALYRLFGIPMSSFTDYWLDAEPVISREVFEVNDRLANCLDYGQMIEIVEEYLKSKIRKLKTDSHSIDKVASYILANPSRVSLDWFASQACLCQRQFYRKFNERMGVSPKLYNRIVRFYQAYQYKEAHPNEDWLSISLQFGYSDYQHMVKDFKEFSRVTPTSWINQDNRSPERILKLA